MKESNIILIKNEIYNSYTLYSGGLNKLILFLIGIGYLADKSNAIFTLNKIENSYAGDYGGFYNLIINLLLLNYS